MPSIAPVAAGIGRRVWITALAAVVMASIGGARAADAPDAGGFLSDLSARAIGQLTEPGVSEDVKRRRFRVLMNEGFDIEAIGRFVLGRYWRGARDAERQAFLAVFEDLMVIRFLPVFGDFAGETLLVGAVRRFGDSPNFFNVSSELRRKTGEPVRIDWRIRKGPEGFEILDVIVEGVSVAVTLRSEYDSVLKRNGGDVGALTRALREKTAGR